MRVKGLLGTALAVVACAAGIAAVQPHLAANAKKTKRDDISVLPPPKQLKAMVLGYRTLAADLLWAKLVVEHGLRWEERLPFPDLPRYIDAIIALEPDHPILYQFVDTLLVFKPGGGTEDDARLARRYLERAAHDHPHDPELWLHYGEFVAFLGPSFLPDQAERDAWRRDGALAIARSVDMGADPTRTLAASVILSEAGEREAAIKNLQRHYALTDDPETRRQIMLKLQKLEATAEAEAAVGVVEHHWRYHFPFVSRGTTLLVGPQRSAATCAGPRSYQDKACPRDWSMATSDAR